ncbi:MAG TPA: anthranilate synthase component I family protein [Bacteroidales bacterium]|nr:anthranilate synthase component I family protein [Bacteroidales bacterium]
MKFKIEVVTRQILADTITPVSVYLKLRDVFPYTILLESSDYHGSKGSWSFICCKPIATFKVEKGKIYERFPNQTSSVSHINDEFSVADRLNAFRNAFDCQSKQDVPINGIFGYAAYDAIEYFENIKLNTSISEDREIPEIFYSFYQYIIAINQFHNKLYIIENLMQGEKDSTDRIEGLLQNRSYAMYPFKSANNETSNKTDEEYMNMVTLGKQSCQRGDVFQIVLSRRFTQTFTGDEFNVYRALRSINPSPYLFYFDYGSFKIFGSSPEAEIEIKGGKAAIHPIAGTFKRTGNDEQDKILAEKLSQDKKENAEHVMLVDLARNDLSRNASNVTVETYREIQYYSHVLHMVSVVSGQLPDNYNPVQILADSFPAGTLSGAPKYKAMTLIDKYEGDRRGYYGGCIGFLGFNGDCNHAIMIRSFLSKDNRLFYQAGAGIVLESKEESELAEVNNKLAALKSAIVLAENLK